LPRPDFGGFGRSIAWDGAITAAAPAKGHIVQGRICRPSGPLLRGKGAKAIAKAGGKAHAKASGLRFAIVLTIGQRIGLPHCLKSPAPGRSTGFSVCMKRRGATPAYQDHLR
jgi:hypothetical protein